MAKDIKALELLRKELSDMKKLPDPPKDIKTIETFDGDWSVQIESTNTVFETIRAYTKAIDELMELIKEFLERSTNKVQTQILKIIDSWTRNSDNGSQSTKNVLQGIEKLQKMEQNKFQLEKKFAALDKQPISNRTSDIYSNSRDEELRHSERLQKMEQKKNRLEESLLKTQELLSLVNQKNVMTVLEMDNLKGCIKSWIHVRDESYEDEKRRKEKEEQRKKEIEAERKRQEEVEKQRQQEMEEYIRKQKAEKKRLQEEEAKQEEERKKREEEEERIRKEIEERKRKEEEEARRRREELKRTEEEKRRKEEEKRRREEELKRILEERKRKDEEEIRKKQEELRKAEEEKQRREEERRRKNKMKIEEERKRKEEELKRAEEEKQRREAERKRKEEEKRRIETMRREEEEARRRHEELKIAEEERRREEEEKARKEKERLRNEEEERKKKEEERKRKEEEKRRRQEEIKKAEEEKRQREAEKKRKEEERRRIEEEMRREREKKKKEEDERKRRLDPNNWTPLRYMRNDGEVDGAREGLCCLVSAVSGQLNEDDLQCLASDEYIEGDESLNLGDKPASSMIHISSRTGRKSLEAPMRVFVPYNPVDSDEEIAIKCSTDGQSWEEKDQIYQPNITNDFKDLSLIAAEINHYEEAKMRVVARTKSENIIVEKQGLTHQSSIDKKVKFVFPRDTFSDRTSVKLQICQLQPVHLKLALQQNDNYEKILSTSPLVTITCEENTDVAIDVDIARPQHSETRPEKGCYHHVYRGKDKQWHFADSGIKNRNQDVTVSLPRGRRYYSVLEIETRKDVSRDTVLQAAENIFNHITKSVVRLIAKQKADNPSSLNLQCVRRDLAAARLAELDRYGYKSGPDASREFCMSDGQEVILKCKGNIGMNTTSNQNSARLVYRVYMDSAKQEVSLFVVDENKQRDNNSYLGLLLFETVDRDGRTTTGDMPISLPKTHQEKLRTTRATVRFQPYLSAMCKYVGWKLTQGVADSDESWLQVMNYLGSSQEIRTLYRRAKTEFGDEDKAKICQAVLEKWMKSKPVQDDKVQAVLSALEKSSYTELTSDCKRFVAIHKVLFSEEVLSSLSNSTKEDLQSLVAKLQLPAEVIKHCANQEKDGQMYYVWSKWQLSDAVICKGVDASDYCLETMLSLTSNRDLIQDLKLKLQQS